MEIPKKVARMGVIVAKEWDGQIGCMLGRHDAIILAEYGCNSHFFLYIALAAADAIPWSVSSKSSATDWVRSPSLL